MICKLIRRVPLVALVQDMVKAAEGIEEYIESVGEAYRR